LAAVTFKLSKAAGEYPTTVVAVVLATVTLEVVALITAAETMILSSLRVTSLVVGIVATPSPDEAIILELDVVVCNKLDSVTIAQMLTRLFVLTASPPS